MSPISRRSKVKMSPISTRSKVKMSPIFTRSKVKMSGIFTRSKVKKNSDVSIIPNLKKINVKKSVPISINNSLKKVSVINVDNNIEEYKNIGYFYSGDVKEIPHEKPVLLPSYNNSLKKVSVINVDRNIETYINTGYFYSDRTTFLGRLNKINCHTTGMYNEVVGYDMIFEEKTLSLNFYTDVLLYTEYPSVH
jgi:hypothetical protein